VTGAAMPSIPLADAKTIRSVRDELAKREGELKDCSGSDETATARLQYEISRLQNYLAEVGGHRGRPRAKGGAAERARSGVTHDIDRAITRIAEQHGLLAKHLRNSIRTGSSPCA